MPKLKFKDSSGEWIEIVGIKGDKGEQGPAGKDGATGADGYTPVKGTDYYTEADKQELIETILASLADGDEVSY